MEKLIQMITIIYFMNTNRELISSTMDSVMEISTTTKRKVGGK